MAAKLTTQEFRAAIAAGGADAAKDATIVAPSTGEPIVANDASRTVRFVFSDSTVDHSNDTIDPAGWDLSVFAKNSVILWAHDASIPPVGRGSNVAVRNGKLIGDVTFATAAEHPLADTLFRLIKGRFLKGCSVGFIPLRWALTSDKSRPHGIDFKEQRLLELSIVGIPANPSSLALSRGLDLQPLKTWAEGVLGRAGGAKHQSPEERLRHARQIRAALGPPTREERIAEAAQIKRDMARHIEEPWQRELHASELRRRLKAEGLI
jgi:HK97 family phage prohead protease